MPRTRALKTIARCNRSFTPIVFSAAHVHTAFSQEILALPRMDVRRK
jgi:hypothetical protein